MSLTDDWKGGKLPFGEYWCKVTDSPYIEKIMSDCMTEDDIIEILAPVPSYEEVQRLKKENDDLSALITSGELEIGHLRHLLKECRTAFETYAKEDETCGLEEENKYAKHLLTRINAAIGESEE